MSTSTGGVKTQKRRNSRKVSSPDLKGHAAIACLVLGCGYTVYSNVFGASVYPKVDSAAFEAPVVGRASSSIARTAAPSTIINNVFADFGESAPVVSPPATIAAVNSIMFNERFAAAAPQSEPSRVVEAPTLAEAPSEALLKKERASASASVQIALATPTQSVTPAPRAAEARPKSGISVRDMAQRAKAAVMSVASGEKPTMVEKLWGKEPSHGSLLSFASADASVTGSIVKEQNPMLGGSPPYDRQTAVYDISAKTVYLPDGTTLEAHSGLGSKMDDARSAHVRMQGVTPPHIYELTPRESLFHGVPALRLNPIGGEDKIFGRDGLLAHTYMLGGNGQSNGCVSFRDYYAFLNAYKNQGIKKLAVVAKVE